MNSIRVFSNRMICSFVCIIVKFDRIELYMSYCLMSFNYDDFILNHSTQSDDYPIKRRTKPILCFFSSLDWDTQFGFNHAVSFKLLSIYGLNLSLSNLIYFDQNKFATIHFFVSFMNFGLNASALTSTLFPLYTLSFFVFSHFVCFYSFSYMKHHLKGTRYIHTHRSI